MVLDLAEVNSLRGIAQKEGVDSTYVSRMVTFTTLGPDVVTAAFDQTVPPEATLLGRSD